MQILQPEPAPKVKDLKHEGKVISAINANEFTYLELERAGIVEWVVAPLLTIKVGSTIRYEDGSMMANFYSKVIERTFPTIRFVGEILITSQP